jgi:hypothetical protein
MNSDKLPDLNPTGFCVWTYMTFIGLRDYIDKSEFQLAALANQELNNPQYHNPPADEPDIGYIMYQHEHLFPLSLRYSFVVLLHLIVEDRLRQACDLIQKIRALPIRAKDLRGDTLEQCMVFLDRLVRIPRQSISTWPRISDLSKIQNCIVHSSGRVEESRDKDYLKILVQQENSLIDLSNNEQSTERQLVISPEYCVIATLVAGRFFEEVFEAANLHHEDVSFFKEDIDEFFGRA